MDATTSIDQKFVTTISQVPYYIEIFLYNELKDDGYKPFPITFNIVDELSIEESLFTWIVKGYITLTADFEILEKGALSVNNGNNMPVKAPYVFRTDGRNKISFRIRPLVSDPTYYDKDWEMSFDCVIYNIKDLKVDSNGRKKRRYYFWDERYQILNERNIDYSSVYSNPNFTSGVKLTDQARAYNPNLMLKDIITTAASNPPVMKKGITNTPDSIKIGFDYKKGETIDDPKQPMASFDDANWDNGDQGNLYFYTSPAKAKAIGDVSDVLDHCVSAIDKNSPLFLRFGRTTSDKTWKLISLASLFRTSGSNQIERFFIQDGIAPATPYYPRSWNDSQGTNNINYVSPMGSRIENYQYSPMTASDDSRITNSPVHNYNFNTNTYNIYFTDNTAKSVRDNMQASAKDGLYNFTSFNNYSDGAHILLNLNQSKQNGIILDNVLKTSTFFPKNYAGIQMQRDALFLNSAISFDVNGITLRTAGKFIFIDSNSSTTLNPHDDRFLGQWLTVKINHIFTKDAYTNNVCAVKVDTHSKLWTQNDKTK
jgi:hypothetical protein